MLACPAAYALLAGTLISVGEVEVGSDLLDRLDVSTVCDVKTEALIAIARMNIALHRLDPQIETYAGKARSLWSDDVPAQMTVTYQLGIYYAMTRRLDEAESCLNEALAFYRGQGAGIETSDCLTWLAYIENSRGNLHRAEEMLKQSLGLTEWSQCTGLKHFLLGGIYINWNNLEGAVSEFERVVEWEKANVISPLSFVLGQSYLLTAHIHLIKGDTVAATRALEKAEQVLTREDPTAQDVARFAGYRLAIALEEDDEQSAAHWLDQLAEYRGPFLNDMPAGVRHLVYERSGDAGRERLQTEYALYHRKGYQGLEVTVRLEQALLSSDPDEALAFAAEALAMARPENNIRALVFTGAPMAPLLRRAIAAGVEPGFVRKVLRIIEDEEHQRKIRRRDRLPAADLFSKREMEVLRLMKGDTSNLDIAETLMISLSTVKTHIHHILEKLEVKDRSQAVFRAKALGLLRND